jgi:hypothetical protein
MTGAAYDSKNFELHNALSNKTFKINVFLKKSSWEYILLSSFVRKMAFLPIFKPKREKTTIFCAIFVYFGWLGIYVPPLTLSTTTPCPGTCHTNSRRTKQFLSHLHNL